MKNRIIVDSIPAPNNPEQTMSTLTYEEAIAELKSMFGAKWPEDFLGAVLEHHGGHMENTVGTILDHENDDPADVVAKLQNPSVAAAAAAAAAAACILFGCFFLASLKERPPIPNSTRMFGCF